MCTGIQCQLIEREHTHTCISPLFTLSVSFVRQDVCAPVEKRFTLVRGKLVASNVPVFRTHILVKMLPHPAAYILLYKFCQSSLFPAYAYHWLFIDIMN